MLNGSPDTLVRDSFFVLFLHINEVGSGYFDNTKRKRGEYYAAFRAASVALAITSAANCR